MIETCIVNEKEPECKKGSPAQVIQGSDTPDWAPQRPPQGCQECKPANASREQTEQTDFEDDPAQFRLIRPLTIGCFQSGPCMAPAKPNSQRKFLNGA